MSRFWIFVTVVFGLGLALLFIEISPGFEQDITFWDLETECSFGREEDIVVTVSENRVNFEGGFPIESTRASLYGDYTERSGSITLDVRVREVESETDYVGGCQGLVVYDASTERLEPGEYEVRVRHDGELKDKRIIEIR